MVYAASGSFYSGFKVKIYVRLAYLMRAIVFDIRIKLKFVNKYGSSCNKYESVNFLRCCWIFCQ